MGERNCQERHWDGVDRRTPPFWRSVLPSVLASLIITALISFVTFVGTMSRMTVMFENMERRVTAIESEVHVNRETRKSLEVNLTRTQTLLDQIKDELSNVRTDVRGLYGRHTNNP